MSYGLGVTWLPTTASTIGGGTTTTPGAPERPAQTPLTDLMVIGAGLVLLLLLLKGGKK